MSNRMSLAKLKKSTANFVLKIILSFLLIPGLRNLLRGCVCLIRPRRDVLMRVGEFQMHARSFDRIMAVFFWKYSDCELNEHEFIKRHVHEGMQVVDIGANIGYHTLQLAKSVGSTGKVYAFEPDPENYRLLLKNLEVNGFRNTAAIPKAIAAEEGTLNLYQCAENKGDHRIYNSHDGRASIKVESTSLDAYFRGRYAEIDFIKMDTQGAECLALQGMKVFLQQHNRLMILCEFAPWLLVKSGFSGKQFLSAVRDLGLEIYLFDHQKTDPDPVNDDVLLRRYSQEGRYASLLLKKKSRV